MKKILLSALFCGFVLNNVYSYRSVYWLSDLIDGFSRNSWFQLFDLSDEYSDTDSDTDLSIDDVKEDYKYLDRQRYILLSEISQSQDTGLEEGFMDFLKYISKTRDDFFQRDFKNDPRFKLIHQLYKKGTEIESGLRPIIGDNFDIFCDYCNWVRLEQFVKTPEQFQNDYIAENVGPFDINDQNNRQRFFTELTKAMDNIFPEEFSPNVRFEMVSHIFGSFVDESLAGKPLLSHGNLNKRSVNECYLCDYFHADSDYGAKFAVEKHVLEFVKKSKDFSPYKCSSSNVMSMDGYVKICEIHISQILENFKNFLNTDFCKNELGYDSVLSLDRVMDTERYIITLFNSRSYLMWRPEYDNRYIFRLIDFFNGDEISSYYSWHYNIKSRYLDFFDDEGNLEEGIIHNYSTRGDEVFKMTDEEKFRYLKN